MKANDNYRHNRLPEKYKVPPNKRLEELHCSNLELIGTIPLNIENLTELRILYC